MRLTVIIPTFQESANIKACIDSVKRLNPFEIIIVDGGSTDDTGQIALLNGARLIKSIKGRGAQLQAGAMEAKGDILMFVHADARICENLLPEYLESAIYEGYSGGFFKLQFDDASLSTKVVEFFANLRSRAFRLPYGDQGIFIKKDVFNMLGGFKKYPFLEDLDFVRRTKKISRLKYMPFCITVSARRIKKGYPLSPILVSLRNVIIALLFIMGVKPDKLIRLYK